MVKRGFSWFTAVVTCAILSGNADHAFAGHHHRWGGSSGSSGSSGSWGSSGSSGSSGSWGSGGSSGSSGSWGSSGSSGSSGSWGSSGSSGSSGGWGSSGSSGSSGGWGSSGSGGSSGGVVVVPVTPDPPFVSSTTMPVTPATVVITVPEDATVYFAGRKMVTAGTNRKYLVPIQKAGAVYEYPIKVEVVRNGAKLVSETRHKVQSGKTLELTMTESNSPDVISVVQR